MNARERNRRDADPVARRMIRVGCSGWSYEDWRGRLYPEEGSTSGWLARYAEVFDTVEVNATFYRLPTRAAVERWASATPEGFCFAVKASRYLTHVRRLRELPEGMRRLAERIEPLISSAKLGPMLWQLPATFRRDDARLASALAELPPGRHAFEFRHPSWFADETVDLLRAYDAALVVADRAPGAPTPWIETASWTYLRFHRGRRRNGGYTRAQLEPWAERIADVPGDVYAYFNNDWEGLAVENARVLLSLLERRAAPAGRGGAGARS
jgi:uncharacterized protein YecE (DUF72 family)